MAAIPPIEGGFPNIATILSIIAIFMSVLNALWDRIRLEHRITKVETMLEIYFKNMTEDAVHIVKHPTQKRKDDLIDKGVRNLTDTELEELHTLLIEDIPRLKREENLLLPGYAVSKAMVEIEQFKRAYPPQRGFFRMVFNLICGVKDHEEACKKACGETNKTKVRNLDKDTSRDIIRDSARDATRDVIRDRTRDEIRDLDRDQIEDKKKLHET